MLFSTIGTFGRVLCILFFACLSIAGVTSLVANMELVTHTLYDFGGTTVCIILIWIHFAIECVLPCFCFIIKISVDFLVVPRKFGMPCTVVLTFLGGLASALNLDILTNQVHLLFWFEILSTYTSLRTWNYHLHVDHTFDKSFRTRVSFDFPPLHYPINKSFDFQDFVWGFALVINGFMLQIMVVTYGTKKFREDMFNRYSMGDWKLPRVWEWLVK